MGITDEHYQTVRKHFFKLLGSKCYNCNFNDYSKIHFHHINDAHIINGEKNTGRGREKRMWELFTAFENNNIMLLCPECHSKTENYKRKKT